MKEQIPSPSPTPPRFGIASVAGRRKANEDAWGVSPPGDPVDFYVVADGVGGQERGDVASRVAAEAAVRAFREHCAAGADTARALRAAIDTANHEVYQLARQMGVERMGCTLAAAAVAGGRLEVAHVGDARAYLLQGSRLYHLTKDHTWVQEQVDQGTISPEDAARHEFRHIVQRVLGNEATVEASYGGPWGIDRNDRLLLTSDGVHDSLADGRIMQLLGGAAGQVAPQAAAEALVAAALAAGSEDNATALVVAGPAGAADLRTVPGGSRRALTEQLAAAAARPSSGQMAAAARPTSGQMAAAPRSAAPRRLAPGPVLVAVLLLGGLVLLAALLSRGGGGMMAAQATTDATRAAAINITIPAPAPAATSTSAPAVDQPGAAYPPAADPAPEADLPAGVCAIKPGSIVFMWTDEQAGNDDLCEHAQIRMSGERVFLLPGEPRRMAAMQRFGFCYQNDFVRVQSVDDPAQVGWILQEHLDICR